MFRAVTDRGRQAKQRLTGEVRSRIRERAIKKAKVRIALHGRKVQDLSEDDLEIIVAEEEEKIRKQLVIAPLIAIAVVLGIT
ncbi:MAG: hypothetical protein OXQ90_04905 [Gammaproteobacteria bacterium]|nr:hypothetical protein [Gammaproteobacteria bacterium]